MTEERNHDFEYHTETTSFPAAAEERKEGILERIAVGRTFSIRPSRHRKSRLL